MIEREKAIDLTRLLNINSGFSFPRFSQEQLRKRKEEEERIAAQNEFLNRSLRGSRKLQALENRPQGAVNDAFAEDDINESSRSTTPAPQGEKEIVHAIYGKFWFFFKVNNEDVI